ncbi:MAG: ABC transporter permease [Lachnospiraceae bacterium]|nr:ABC transporter permease [Lachnospiraceae bacterium]
MSWIDLLRMSSGNLRRRKLRTILTVLGVVIGISSIVVMISLGLGMQQSMYKTVETSGGLTNLKVVGGGGGYNSMQTSEGGENKSDTEEKQLTKAAIENMNQISNVKEASPMIYMNALIKKGAYIANVELYGMEHNALVNQKMELEEWGTLPTQGNLNLLLGNMIPQLFYNEKTGEGYWETGEMADIDFEKDQMFLILDQESYSASQQKGVGDTETETKGTSQTAKAVKKHAIIASGLLSGGSNVYNANSYAAFCDLDTLEKALKKEFSGRVIPGQPTTKSGKALKYMVYSYASVQVDDIKNVEKVSSEIRNMGYEVQSNAEYLNSMKKQMAVVQAVLGGIGAISMLVAAIGIANTMMMSIYERTKEIGVIKVLGCSLKNIKQLFLLEAGFLGIIGGIVGNILGVIISVIVNIVATNLASDMGLNGNISYIPIWLVLLSTAFAVIASMIAGYFPALRAMRLSPLAAIRNE